MINKNELNLLRDALETLEQGDTELPAFTPQHDARRLGEVIVKVAERMQDNYPYYHPQYAGQMLKPPHPVARIAYALSLWVNPNNHALDGGRASSAMEKECVVELGSMFGWQGHLGHLTSGGTMANLEALWVASRLHPDERVIGSEQAHYTHSRISDVLGITYTPIGVTRDGRMDVALVENELKKGDVGTVVVTMGNTGLGAVDPLADILALRESYDFRIHADAAYGGYFGLSSEIADDTAASYACLTEVDSIVIDPHKHGLQPYGCGCILFRDPAVGTIYMHESPYTYFSSAELHLGEISLECSRAGASAVALWATHQLIPPVRGGEFAAGLDAGLRAARGFHTRLLASRHFQPIFAPELDIVVYAALAADSQTCSERAASLFDIAAKKGLHLALIQLPADLIADALPGIEVNTDVVTCLRSVLMKPEHEEWMPRLVEILETCAEELG
ncbi:MAG: aminotransferase class V-fold PLP-dependent enzyme [Gammaproteobacteria bacterium]|nr:aminotransferase class V-fold PLP-dependent enzyme [Gammaproteobacteria bacterium]